MALNMGRSPKEGDLRRLTLGEIVLARQVFGDAVAYHRVWIHYDSYLPLGLQRENTAMAPNGEIYLRKGTYLPDFSTGYYRSQHMFIHEMGHVWQHQQGMWVRTRGLLSWAANYHYRLDGKKLLHHYPMEQQAQIIADYFLLRFHGWNIWSREVGNVVTFQGITDRRTAAPLYQYALTKFFTQR
ncbi:type IV secretion protein Rhs [Serratia rubidaea]|uniref:type IV secretion protein Rhs n=1 Tax=Serratia rubidaea TaxID=61652 RepID=UPI0022B8B583|nr:type IV secretion protein Rhs [Serratia rubidaea]WBF44520.1 type IV secretion protein Rhs [Serratia rubidaea]